MAVAISPTRTFTIPCSVDDDISVTFTFKSVEDAIRKEGESGTNSLYRVMRQSITSATGFTIDDSTDFKMTDEIQRNIFQWMMSNDPEFVQTAVNAYEGITPKKLESGAKQQENGIGTQASVTDAN